MNANSWIWIALIAFLVFCCIGPMLFMGRHRKHSDHASGEDRKPDK